MDMKVSSALGYEHAHNAMLGIDDDDLFVDRAVGSLTRSRGPATRSGAPPSRTTPSR